MLAVFDWSNDLRQMPRPGEIPIDTTDFRSRFRVVVVADVGERSVVDGSC